MMMASSGQILALLPLLFASALAYDVVQPVISVASPQGIKFQYPHEDGITLVAYHYNLNEPLPGVAAGEYNVDVNAKTGDYWEHENTAVNFGQDDTLYYWVYVVYNGQGAQLTDQSWTLSGETTVKPPATTNAPVTQPSTTKSSGGTNPSTTQSSGGGGGLPVQCSHYPCASSCDMSVAPCNGLIFEDNFDDFNLDIWEHELTAGGGGNWEFQYYTNNRSNSYVKDGALYLKPTLTEDKYGEGTLYSATLDLWGASPANLCTGNAWYGCQRTGGGTSPINPIQSARVRTTDSFSFKYGRLEVQAKLPVGDWLWPAIWLLPRRNAYGDWPASGEIDLVESRGNKDLQDENGIQAGVNQMGSTMHWGPYWPQNGWPKTHNTKNLPSGQTFGDAFHNFTLGWTSESLTFYVDSEELLKVDPTSGFWDLGEFGTAQPGIDNPWANSNNKLTPFDQEFYLILNVAVGGTNYFGDNLVNSPSAKPWENTSPSAAHDFWQAKDDWFPTWVGEDAAMKIDSVRVYASDETTYHLQDR